MQSQLVMKDWVAHYGANEIDKHVSHRCKDQVHVSTLIKIVFKTHLWLTSGLWVFQRLSHKCLTWHDASPITTIVNLNNNLIRLVHDVLVRHHLYGELKVEQIINIVTFSIMMWPLETHWYWGASILHVAESLVLWYCHSIVSWITLWFPALIQILEILARKNSTLPWKQLSTMV